MKKIFVLLCMITCFCIFAEEETFTIYFNEGVTDTKFPTQLEMEIVHELNVARTNPQRYAKYLQDILQYYKGRNYCYPNEITMVTNEGAAAVREAIAFLQKQTPLEELTMSKGMTLAARDMVADQSASGQLGHIGRDGSSPFDRMNRYGKWDIYAGENIEYGNNIARRIVMALIIDDGVSGRGHRKNIYQKKFKVVGVGCGTHKVYRNMCVMDFAGKYLEK